MNKISQSGVPIDELIDILSKCLQQEDNNVISSHVENLRSRVQSPEHSEKLGQILSALKVPDSLGQGGVVLDPISGNPYPNTKTFIKEYINELQGHKKMSNSTFNFSKFAQDKGKKHNPEKKKDSRGNPFRVLMGKVGKLLDHGLGRRDIVRYLAKEHIWNEETITKAIKIVKEYNTKKHTKNKEEKKIEAQTLPDTKNIWTRIYPDYRKRSTAELITSVCWLHTAATIDPDKYDFAKEVADRSGVKSMIREIKSELVRRGMSEKDLNSLLK